MMPEVKKKGWYEVIIRAKNVESPENLQKNDNETLVLKKI